MTRSLPLAADAPAKPAGSFSFVSLGCPKNTVDSERMLGKLAQDGYALQPDADGADVVVVNTCGFIEPARQESMAVIREMLELKKQGRIGGVIVAGCLAERNREGLIAELPGVDQVLGVFGREEIAAAVAGVAAKRKTLTGLDLFPPAPARALPDTDRLRITPRHFAYLKISEGCDRLCTYCAIPQMRGKHATKPLEQVLTEARELAADGVRELNLVAQDSTYWGMDLYGKPRLADLLRELDRIDGLEWVRLLYAYPEHVTDELLAVMGSSKKLVPYIDIPLQHISDRVLRRMVRRVDRAATETILHRLRAAVPGIAVRTTFIVGFPGETDADFDELLSFVRDFQFERAGVFPYSFEPTTSSAKLDGHLPEEVKLARRDALMEAQQAVAFAHAAGQVGKELAVLIDGPDADSPTQFAGRTTADAPDIDCAIRVKGKGLRAGDLVTAKVTAADGYDLLGRAVGKPR
ncbi:30S ribosomal protein S12 methylthiotransferase RimO [Brasilonema bromeliae]|uniref:Ribosomal protein uS12 methylthiotransferase RimO n=1 Tax=Brasilonema bromeliae SPC951 TaxID=385972 RepID=A0ABX1P9B2_9CYAN|nr:30S ribosomal protein S12 methylthiotransferase RimO [Brasilonema bromeliae SPC951]